RAEQTLAAATETANGLIFNLAQRFRNTVGIPASLVKDILDRARKLQEQLTALGEGTPELMRNEAAALNETAIALLSIGDTTGAFAAADQARQIFERLLATNPDNPDQQRDLAIAYEWIGEVLVLQGKLDEALDNYRKEFAIIDRLVASNPSNSRW